MKDQDYAFIRADLNRMGGDGTAYFRDLPLRDFIQKCVDQGHDVEGFVFTIEGGRVDANIGLVITEPKP
jgi:hypothetical protein